MDIIRREKCFIVGDKQYELLEAKHDPENGVYCWEYIDGLGKQGAYWYSYFTGKAAERICAEQWMLLHTESEADTLFISSFWWETDDESIKLFMLELKLEKAGYRCKW